MSAPVRRGARQDPRIVTFRSALESLIESLDATVRMARWKLAEDPVPEPLSRSAEQLLDRLGSANRFAGGRFVGAPAVIAASDAIKEAVKALDVAFVAYRKHLDAGPGERDEAVIALDAEIGRVKLDAGRWE